MKIPAWLSRDLFRIVLLLTALTAVLLLRRDCGRQVGEIFRSLDEAPADAALDTGR